MNNGLVKNIFFAVFPGGGNTFFILYIIIYDRSKGLTVITVAMVYHQEIQLVGWHWHKRL